jgi:hypothetical protein
MFRDKGPETAHTEHTLDQPGERARNWSSFMAKGQVRGNREVKKPKQPKKTTPVSAVAGSTPLRVPATPAAPKKR